MARIVGENPKWMIGTVKEIDQKIIINKQHSTGWIQKLYKAV